VLERGIGPIQKTPFQLIPRHAHGTGPNAVALRSDEVVVLVGQKLIVFG